jgi:S1-C subfamily serine protease
MGDQDKSFRERLSAFADGERKKAKQLPPGPERDAALTKIRQAETAAQLAEWADSPGLQPSK